MPDKIIPFTKARLQPYITLYTVPGGTDFTQITDPVAFALSLKSDKVLGAVQSLEIKNTRDVAIWRELNSAGSGLPVEAYPNLPTYELTLRRTVLYTKGSGTLLEVFGFSPDSDVINQYKPFIIKVALDAPDKDDKKSIIYFGCWFKDNPLSFDVMAGDLRMIQEVGVTAAGVILATT
jgi:hypothetical protein